MTREESDTAYETAMELLELDELIWVSGETERLVEAEEAYRQAVAIRDNLAWPSYSTPATPPHP
jgi:hypothetical protein